MEESLPELIINLTTDHWVLLPSILVSKKIKKISIFKICGELFGDVTQMQQLKPKDMIKIIEEAHRFNCDIFVFDRVDF